MPSSRLVRLFKNLVAGLLLLQINAKALAAERLDRGVVVISKTNGEVYIGWRLLASDPSEVTFDIYRSPNATAPGQKLNDSPITNSCNFMDNSAGTRSWWYTVQAVLDKTNLQTSIAIQTPETTNAFVRIKLQSNYRADRVALADLDGDGQLDYLVIGPASSIDPYEGQWKKSTATYKIEAYRHDGAFMWRYDMGWAIESGVWYSPVVAYDIDGDGKAEVFCKGGDGDPRNADGRVLSGPEYLIVLDGLTGKVKKRLPWPSRDGFGMSWDDPTGFRRSYNDSSRNLMGIAYLDGIHPHLIVERGTYSLIKLQAFTPSLERKWYWESSGKDTFYCGAGMHGMHCVDVVGDGRDAVIIGSAVIGADGRALWNTGLGHCDVCYVGHIVPDRRGLQIFYGIEPGREKNKVCLVDARTGKILWGISEYATHVHDQGMVGDIDPAHPGLECYGGEHDHSKYWLFSAKGELISNEALGELSYGDLSPQAIYWVDGPTKAYVSHRKIYLYPRRQIGAIQGDIVGIADCMGDFREELITTLAGEIRIYTTTIPATTRRVCLMQDRLYRTDVAAQAMGYLYAPQLGGKPLQDPP